MEADTRKTVLLQAVEARRWTFTYGLGFEAQTGTPQNNCAGATARGVACNPNGTPGVSPGFLGGTHAQQHLWTRTVRFYCRGHTVCSSRRFDLLFQIPHFHGTSELQHHLQRRLCQQQGCDHVRRLAATGRIPLHAEFSKSRGELSKANTFIYEYDFPARESGL